MLVHAVSGGRQGHPARVTFDERHAELRLRRGEVMAHRGLGDVQPPPFEARRGGLPHCQVHRFDGDVHADTGEGDDTCDDRHVLKDVIMDIVIADTGRGMSPAETRLAGAPLYTSKPSGTGLGLTIARKIAEAPICG